MCKLYKVYPNSRSWIECELCLDLNSIYYGQLVCKKDAKPKNIAQISQDARRSREEKIAKALSKHGDLHK